MFIGFVAVVAATSCRTTKYVPDGEYLLNNVRIDGDLGSTNSDELMDYVRQQPNVRVLGLWRPSLAFYNLSGRKDNGFNNWLRTIGSEPVVYDSLLQERSSEQIRMYLESKGYFDAEVSDTMIVTGNKKCDVVYNVDAGRVYRISRIGYHVADDSIRPIVMADTAHSLLKVGDPFDSNVHDEERARLTRELHEHGYYHFGKDFVYFVADSSLQKYYVADSLIIIGGLGETKGDTAKVFRHRKAVVDSVTFVVNRSGHPPIVPGETGVDTLSIDRIKVLYRNKLGFRTRLLEQSSFIEPGKQYKLSNVERTRSRFNSLKLFSGTNINMVDNNPGDTLAGDSLPVRLNCDVSLQMAVPQSFGVDIEGTNSSGNLGGAANIRYRHLNFFRNAEVFELKYRIASQNQFARDDKERFYTFETGVEASLTVPQFLAPFSSTAFQRHRNPTTVFSAAFDYQHRPDFTRSVISTRLGYNWRGSKYVWHSLTPVEMNIVRIPAISQEFADYISGTYLQYSYTDHFIMSLNYTFLFNQQKARKLGDAWYVRYSVETAGSLLRAFTNGQQTVDDFRSIWGIRYSQYVKNDLEVRFQTSDLWMNNIVWRAFAGIGVPYGNSMILPFEKRYFVGGANSIRAWPVRGLGPGASQSDPGLRYHNQTADMRLEMNFEYRFRLVSVLEGALFADAGNIWALRRSTDDESAVITSDFYKQIAFGAGLGLRLNFDYFILRFDAAVKLHDPMAEGGRRWVIATEDFTANSINYNFAIGYPF